MAFLVSPGVQVKEKDLTNIIPAVSTSIGGFTGVFEWGPAMEATTVASESNLIDLFGYPKVSVVSASNTRDDWYSAANFLSYSNNIQLVRVIADDASNATSATDSESTTLSITIDHASIDSDIAVVKFGGTKGVSIAITAGDTSTEIAASLVTALQAKYTDLSAVISSNLGVVTISAATRDFPQEIYSGSYSVGDSENTVSIVTNASEANLSLIENENDWLTKNATLTTGSVYARYPGALGNGIGFAIIDAGISDSDFQNQSLFGAGNTPVALFGTKPSTSVWGTTISGLIQDEVHVVVYTTDSTLTGTANELLETYSFLSKGKNSKTSDGATNFYVDYINNNSKWVYVRNEETAAFNAVDNSSITNTTAIGTTITSLTSPFKLFNENNAHASLGIRQYALKNGSDGTSVSDAQRMAGWAVLNDVEAVDVSLLVTGNVSTTVKKYVVNIAETRKDAVAFVSPDYASAVTNPTSAKVAAYFNNSTTGFNSSSYVMFDSGWKRQYDRYNDEYFWAPLNADIAGLTARTDYSNDSWFSPAGLNRGFIQNVVKLSFNPTQSDRDTLYTQRVNPVVTFKGQGTLLYGDKTGLSRPSAFDRINVRRLFIALEKAIATASKFQLFEFNDDITRRAFINAVEPFLNEVKSRRGMTDYKVVCDSSNNTSEVVANNRFVADIYIKPSSSINFITLNFVAVRSGVSFNEVAG